PSGELGINIAAAKELAPDKGLKVYLWPWSQMGEGDGVVLMVDDNIVDQTVISKAQVGQRTTLHVASARWQTGSHQLKYEVTRAHQTPEVSFPPVRVYCKFERPGGKDENGSTPGHSELYMYIDPKIIQDGVDKDTAESGFDIIIKARSGSSTPQPYPNCAVGDVCRLSWGGIIVYSMPVTQQNIDDPDNFPLIVRITKAIIEQAGDTNGLDVTFEVRDIVDNRSEDWSAAIRIAVNTGVSRLQAPIVKEANNNVLNLDTLGNAPVTLQIIALDPPLKLGDVIIGRIRGTTEDGETVDVEVRGEPLLNLPSIVEIELPNGPARLLAKTQAVFSYRVERSGSDDLLSKGQFVNLIGETRRLLAPVAIDAHQGALDPALDNTVVNIPFDDVMQAGMVLVLRWVATLPDLGTYDPELDWITLTQGHIDAAQPIPVIVEGTHLRASQGGTLDLFYELLAEAADGSVVRRESIHHAPLQIGEPQLELAPPVVLGEQGGVLKPEDLPGGASRLTAPRATLPTKSGDRVTFTWIGSVTGRTTDSVEITSLTADKAIVFTLSAAFVAQHLLPNLGGTIRASYEIYRAAAGGIPERISYSNPLEFTVGEALALTPPRILQAESDGKTLQPINAVDALTAVIDAQDLQFSDQLSVKWQAPAGTPAGGSHTTPASPISETTLNVALPISVLAFCLGKTVTLTYLITRDGKTTESLPLTLSIGVLPVASLNSPILTDAVDGVLDVTKLGANA
ncbi:hypothetical protein ABE529_27880, partial [Pseudomonas koreensis]